MTLKYGALKWLITTVVMAFAWHATDLGMIPTDDLFSKMAVIGGSGILAWLLSKFLIPKEVSYN